MQNITFNNTQLTLVEDSEHGFLLSNKDVALGYGTSLKALTLTKSRNEDELIEGKHWIRIESQTRGGKQRVIHWTKKGIVRLGFFIKSENAKKFRDWAEDYIVNPHSANNEVEELKRIILEQNRLIASSQNRPGMSELCQLLNDYAPPAFHKRLVESLKNIKDIADGKMSIGDGVLIDPMKLMEQGIKYDALQLKYELLNRKYKKTASNLVQFENDMENSVELISSLHKKLGIFTERMTRIKREII